MCASCAPLVRHAERPGCPTCALPRPQIGTSPAPGIDAPCRTCRRLDPPQTDAHACWLYEDLVASAIQQAKYAGARWRLAALADPMAEWLSELAEAGELAACRDTEPPALVTAVPMHPAELRARGYNTAIQVARRATIGLDIEHDWQLLAKTRRTPPQAGLARSARLANVTDAFRATAPDRIDGRPCLLFDDVVTTGATAAEVAGVLAEAGATCVSVVSAARAPLDAC